MHTNNITPSWKGIAGISRLVVFGDSYSDVGYLALMSPHPTEVQPLGVEFPGVTWTESDTANWVGHLITNYSPHGQMLVYDYAVGGDTVSGVRIQIRNRFLPTAGRKPDWAPWSSTDTLFITWVGINDCGGSDDEIIGSSLKELFKEQEALYEAGARNFLLVDVPPIHLSPIGRMLSNKDVGSQIYRTWNAELDVQAAAFSTAHPDATVLQFSSWDTFNRVLDDPVAHGFATEDVRKSGGGIWVDHLHPTSRMHDWIAKDLADFLASRTPTKE
ncbi:carbohydrate esterase family 16 protein [Laetiporus sulphureus 93-53]|uniref:Carbohydrate esterase family 16 protein n=1 Tax=Laetiporus sulphureus 93-53 TaxID=1314785 RepID=A0A165F2U6_9APHY|nr:carbohydrate esterase family 16 protein [Laetiporus sulphureus 93-53]KZT08256.1 carbohydrate esterase family 16 protein [Laetiporus sulphureus 93-53]